MSLPKLGIIMLTYNSVSKLGMFFDKVLESVLRVDYENLHVIIVDNCSKDHTVSYVKEYVSERDFKKRVRILRLRRNYGWAGGSNRGAFALKNTNYLFFMNDDIVLKPNALKNLVDAMENIPELGAVQPVIVNSDGTYNMGFSLSLGYTPNPITAYDITKFLSNDVVEISYAMGAALLTRTRLFFKLGMFDESYFYWFEDVDYCLRLQSLGYKIGCLLNTYVYHYGSATLGKSNPKLNYYYVRNHIWFLIKNMPLTRILVHSALGLVESATTTLLHNLRIGSSLAMIYTILGYKDGIVKIKKALEKRTYIGNKLQHSLSPKITGRILKLIK